MQRDSTDNLKASNLCSVSPSPDFEFSVGTNAVFSYSGRGNTEHLGLGAGLRSHLGLQLEHYSLLCIAVVPPAEDVR